MSAPYQTRSEQKLEFYKSLTRPLTDEESDELYRAMHAVYEHERRQRIVASNRTAELKLLAKLRQEAKIPSRLA